MNVSRGDLAFIVGEGSRENFGCPVLVLEYTRAEDMDWWLCESNIPLRIVNKVGVTRTRAYVPDQNLRRISGPSIDIGIDEEKPVESEV